jgi:predicted component of type VI protein secretion system
MIRDNRNPPQSAEECEQFLNTWLGVYVLVREDASGEEKARHPLRLRPHLQMADPVKPLRLSFELRSAIT